MSGLDCLDLLGYLGPGTDLHFIPSFLGLVAWAGLAFGAVLLWPLRTLVRRWRRPPQGTPEQPPTRGPSS